MINSYNITDQILDVNETITFSNNRVLTGCTVTHAEGTGTFRLNKPGYYYVAFNGDGSTLGTAGDVSIQLYNADTLVPGALASGYSAAAGNAVNLSFSTIIKVTPSCCCSDGVASITLKNIGVEATLNNANLTITKLC